MVNRNSDAVQESLKKILEISQKINSLVNLHEILNDIMKFSRELLNAEGSSLLLLDKATNELFFEVTMGAGADKLKQVRVPVGKGIAGYVAQTGEALIINDAQNDPRFFKKADEVTGVVTKNIIAVPLKKGSEIIGVLEVVNAQNREGFNELDLMLITHFAEQATTAIVNAFLYREIRNKAKELECMYRISNATNFSLKRDRLFKDIVQIVSESIGAERISIMFESAGELYIEMALGIPERVFKKVRVSVDSDRICARVFRNAETLWTNDVNLDPRFGRNKKFRYRYPSFVSAPIISKGKVIGVLNISERKNPFTGDDVSFINAIANQIGHAYESVILYEQELEQERLKQEMEVMKKLQNSILPHEFGDVDVDVYATMKPARMVGGDFYDFRQFSKNKFAVLVGDVSGKGLPASLFMTISRTTIRAYLNPKKPPSNILKSANNVLVEDSRYGMFITAFFAFCDLSKNQISYSNAGHGYQFLYKASKGSFEELKTRGKPLGVKKGVDYSTKTSKFSKGDILVLFTDGVVEAINEDKEEYGEERLREVVRENSHRSARDIVEAVMEDVKKFTGTADQSDDITVVVVKF